MKNKEFYKLLKKNNINSDSGFTLTELLVGLIMSIFVIGALGFGLMQALRFTTEGDSKTLVRNDLGRASEFISDEMRRASAVEVDNTMANINPDGVGASNPNGVASDFPLPTGGSVRLALQIPGVSQRVVYSVAPPQAGSPWKGPLVIYRWGPNFDANGNYTDPNPTNFTDWDNQALVDGVSDVPINTTGCTADSADNDAPYLGFFACIVDNDGDTDTEDAADTNGDGVITFADDPLDRNGDGIINNGDDPSITTFSDSTWDKNGDNIINNEDAADIDGLATTAQLYFAGETKEADGINTDTYSANTKVTSRVKDAPDNNSNNFSGYITSFRTLDPSFSCNPDDDWGMRTDFGESLTNPSNLSKWDHQADRQPQPITMPGSTLVISSNPKGQTGVVTASTDCLNSRTGNGHGNTGDLQDFAGNKSLTDGDWHTDPDNDIVAISHVIDFNDPRTFNGKPSDSVCTGSACYSTNGKVLSEGSTNSYVIMLRNGSPVPGYNPYDMNADGDHTDSGEQVSLTDFLSTKGYVDSSTNTITGLGEDERIIAFEIGKDAVNDWSIPGVDFQDNVFILQNDAFSQTYSTVPGDPAPAYSVPY